ncbi:hypothetical protein ACFE04_027713 [Oxalis oulophora]
MSGSNVDRCTEITPPEYTCPGKRRESPPIVLSSAHTLNRVVLCPYAFRPLPNHSSPSTYHGQQLPHCPATPLILDVSNPAATRLFRSLPVAVVSIRILIAINFRTPTSN